MSVCLFQDIATGKLIPLLKSASERQSAVVFMTQDKVGGHRMRCAQYLQRQYRLPQPSSVCVCVCVRVRSVRAPS